MSVQWVSECCGAAEREGYWREECVCPECNDHADFMVEASDVLAPIALLERLARAANAVNEAAMMLYKDGKMQPLCDAQTELELVLTDCERAGVVLN